MWLEFEDKQYKIVNTEKIKENGSVIYSEVLTLKDPQTKNKTKMIFRKGRI